MAKATRSKTRKSATKASSKTTRGSAKPEEDVTSETVEEIAAESTEAPVEAEGQDTDSEEKSGDVEPDPKEDETAEEPVQSDVEAEEVAENDAAEPEAASEPQEDAEPQTAPVPAIAPQPEQRSGGFIPLVLGGIVAGGIGWAVSEYMREPAIAPDTGLADRLAAVESQIAGNSDQIGGNETRIASLEDQPESTPFDPAALDPLKSDFAALAETLEALDARVTALEKAPVAEGASDVAIQAYERELAALQSSVEDQRAEIEGLLANALSAKEATEEQAKRTAAEASLIKILSALDSGSEFAEPLDAMAQTGAVDVPAALSDVAGEGVVTLAELQEGFAGQAAGALAAARAANPEENSGIGGFLQRQLGARSVVPREGDDPDAVLSRAEAAIRAGQLDAALAEIDALPEVAQDEMQDWLSGARQRAAAQAAAQDLAQRLSAN